MCFVCLQVDWKLVFLWKRHIRMECEMSFICKRRGKEVWSLGIVEDGAGAGNFILWHLLMFNNQKY